MTEVHPNVHVCGEKEARELLLLHLPRRNDDDDDDDEKKIPLFSRVVAIGFPSAPLTEEEMTLLVRFRFSIFPFSGEKFVAIFFRARACKVILPNAHQIFSSSSSSSRRTRKSTSFPFLSKTRSTPICSRFSARRRGFFLLCLLLLLLRLLRKKVLMMIIEGKKF